MKSSSTVRLSFYENEINEKIKKTKNFKTPPKIKAKSEKNIIDLLKPSKFKSSDNQMSMNNYNFVYVTNFNENNLEPKIIFNEKNENKNDEIETNKEKFIQKKMSKKRSITFMLPEQKIKKEDNNNL